MVDRLRSSKVVALGGGHGLAASLSALRLVCEQVTAIVTVADNGGSSGRLRDDFGVLPPGDLRMALAALCDDNEWGQTWGDVLQHRHGAWRVHRRIPDEGDAEVNPGDAAIRARHQHLT